MVLEGSRSDLEMGWCRVLALYDAEIVFRTPKHTGTGEAFTRNVRPSPLSTIWDILIPKNNTQFSISNLLSIY